MLPFQPPDAVQVAVLVVAQLRITEPGVFNVALSTVKEVMVGPKVT